MVKRKITFSKYTGLDYVEYVNSEKEEKEKEEEKIDYTNSLYKIDKSRLF